MQKIKKCHIDVTERVEIGKDVVFGGEETQIWTHGFDQFRNLKKAPLRIYDNVYVGAGAIFAGGGLPLKLKAEWLLGPELS